MKQEIKEEKPRILNEIFENSFSKKMYRNLRRNYFIRLLLIYIMPLALLIVYFQYQYNDLMTESRELHLMSVAENQSRILDIFLSERINNILNAINDPDFELPLDKNKINAMLDKLKKNSDAFIDLGYFGSTSIQIEYAGPLPFLENRNYENEPWFRKLINGEKEYVITDIYLGMRNTPHLTIAAKTIRNNQRLVFKVSLDPEKIYQYMTSLEKSNDVQILIIKDDGTYQLTPDEIGKVMEPSPFIPDKQHKVGIKTYSDNHGEGSFAYSWLTDVNWAVVVKEKEASVQSYFNLKIELILISLALLLFLFFIIFILSKNIVKTEKDRQIARQQLEQASKLATVGELASGIAHEIGNPLNIIANEVGIMQDYANPKFKSNKTLQEMEPHFKKIMNAVYRIKDINNKLLTYVRKNDNELEECNINELIENFISGFFEREMKVDNVEIIRKYGAGLPVIKTDINQMKQVIVNLLNNAKDAIEGSGKIIIETAFINDKVLISVTDNGVGIPEDKINKIFLPFFTTKPVGKGTGLGLSVSFSIIKNLGGSISVESELGKGTTFTIELPVSSNISNIKSQKKSAKIQ